MNYGVQYREPNINSDLIRNGVSLNQAFRMLQSQISLTVMARNVKSGIVKGGKTLTNAYGVTALNEITKADVIFVTSFTNGNLHVAHITAIFTPEFGVPMVVSVIVIKHVKKYA